MQISRGIEIIHAALWLSKEKILIISDLHLGYEEALQRKGILIPKFQLQEIIKEMKSILLKARPAKIIINGDLKHEFGTVLKQEWGEVLQFLDFCLQHSQEVIIIKGNHDPLIKPIAEKRGIKVVKEYLVGDTIIVHGDQLIETKAKRIVIGHEHPAITIREKSKWEKYKCFLKGKWKGKELIAVPSFNPLLEGTDVLRNRVSGMQEGQSPSAQKGKSFLVPEDSPSSILKEELLSPFLNNIKNFEVYVVSKGEVFEFGKVKYLAQRLNMMGKNYI